jgi:hypothetical protein
MNHRKVHDQLIDRAKSRLKESGTYYEKHHIIPKCMGGLDSEDNLVNLTAREHFLVHWLLVEIHRVSEYLPKLSHAWNCMRRVSKGQESRKVNSRYFSYAREECTKAKRPKKFDFDVVLYDEESKEIKFEGNFMEFAFDHRTSTQAYSYFRRMVTSNKGIYKGCTHFTKSYFLENELEIRSSTRISQQIKSRKLKRSKYAGTKVKLIKNEFICECTLDDLDGRPQRYFEQASIGHEYKHGPKKGIRIELSN